MNWKIFGLCVGLGIVTIIVCIGMGYLLMLWVDWCRDRNGRMDETKIAVSLCITVIVLLLSIAVGVGLTI